MSMYIEALYICSNGGRIYYELQCYSDKTQNVKTNNRKIENSKFEDDVSGFCLLDDSQ